MASQVEIADDENERDDTKSMDSVCAILPKPRTALAKTCQRERERERERERNREKRKRERESKWKFGFHFLSSRMRRAIRRIKSRYISAKWKIKK
jgi:hypothetical protein